MTNGLDLCYNWDMKQLMFFKETLCYDVKLYKAWDVNTSWSRPNVKCDHFDIIIAVPTFAMYSYIKLLHIITGYSTFNQNENLSEVPALKRNKNCIQFIKINK